MAESQRTPIKLQRIFCRRGAPWCARCRRCRARCHVRRESSSSVGGRSLRPLLRRSHAGSPCPPSSSPPHESPSESADKSRTGKYAQPAPHQYPSSLGARFVANRRRARHNHPSLAIPTLRNLRLQPSPLQRMRPIPRKPLNSENLALPNSRNPRRARSLRHAINMHSASPAKSLPAPKLSPSKLQRIPQNPKQRSLRRNIHAQNRPINIQFVSSHASTSKESPPIPNQPNSTRQIRARPQVRRTSASYKPPSCSDRRAPLAAPSDEQRVKSNQRNHGPQNPQVPLPFLLL